MSSRLFFILVHVAWLCNAMSLDDPGKPPGTSCVPGENTIVQLSHLIADASKASAIGAKSRSSNEPECIPILPKNNAKASSLSQAQAEPGCQEVVDWVQKSTVAIAKEMSSIEKLTNHSQYREMKGEIENHLMNVESVLSKSTTSIIDMKGQATCYVNKVTKKLNEVNSNTMITIFVSLMKLKEYGEAENIWLELNDATQIATIVDRLYGLQYTQQLAAFSQMVRNMNDRATLYQKWYDMMLALGHLTKDEIIVLRKMIVDEGTSIPSALSQLKTKVIGHVNTVVTRWATSIKGGSYSAIISFGSPTSRSLFGFSFSDLVVDIINKAHSSTRSHMWNALQFASGLRWNIHKYSGLNRLYALVGTNDKLLVAYRIKLAMGQLTGPDTSALAQVQQSFNSLKSSMPINVRMIIWHRYCLLKSRGYNEYLMASYYHGDSSNRDLFTYRDGSILSESQFKFIPVEQSNYIYFYLGSQYWQGEHLDTRTTGSIPALRKSSSSKGLLSLEPYSTSYIRIKHSSGGYVRPLSSTKDNQHRNMGYSSSSATSTDDWTPQCYE